MYQRYVAINLRHSAIVIDTEGVGPKERLVGSYPALHMAEAHAELLNGAVPQTLVLAGVACKICGEIVAADVSYPIEVVCEACLNAPRQEKARQSSKVKITGFPS